MASNIPISEIVTVNITSIPTPQQRKGFGTMLIITQDETVIDHNQAIRFYNSITEVAVDWAASTEVFKAAQTYFSQIPRSTTIAVAPRFLTAQSAILQGDGLAEDDILVWNAITTGSFNIDISGAPNDILALDFSLDLTLAAVATTIEAGIQAIAVGGFTLATVTYDSNLNAFRVTAGDTGVTSTISFMTNAAAGVPIFDLFRGAQGQATITNGIDAEVLVQSALNRIDAKDNTWYAFAFTKETRDNTDVEDAASWAEPLIKQFYTVTNNESTKSSASTTDIAFFLNSQGYRRTWVQYSTFPDEYPEVSASGRAATVDFDLDNSTLTLKFKISPTITPQIELTTADLVVFRAKGTNAYIIVANSTMISDSIMSVGVGVYQDTIHGVDWLQNEMETNVFNRLYQSLTKVPLTDEGGAILEREVIAALDQGVRNGLIAPGEDIDGVFLPLGYITSVQKVVDIPAADIAARIGPTITFTAIGAGAIHSIQINGVVEG